MCINNLKIEKINSLKSITENLRKSSFIVFININGFNVYLLSMIRFLVKKYGLFFNITKNSFIRKMFKDVLSKQVCFSNHNNAMVLSNGSYKTFSFLRNLSLFFEKKKFDNKPIKVFHISKCGRVITRFSTKNPLFQFKNILNSFLRLLYFYIRKFLILLKERSKVM